MNCPLHVHSAMTPIVQHYAYTGLDGRYATQRTVYRCPIAGCPRVMAETEVSADERRCNTCGMRITDQCYDLMHNKCKVCRNKENQKRKRKRKRMARHV